MKKLLALLNWPLIDSHNDNTTQEFDHLFTIDRHQPQPNPDEETRPMVRISNRNPEEIQRAIDLAG